MYMARQFRRLSWWWGIFFLVSFSLAAPFIHAAPPLIVSDCSTLGSIASPGTLGYALATHINGDQIHFACDGTLNFAALFTISDDVTLVATGHQVVLDGGSSGPGTGTPFFSITPIGHLHLTQLTFAHGGNVDVGGAIINHGLLDIYECSFEHNAANLYSGAVANYGDGTATITSSQFTDNSVTTHGGGAISNDGLLIITSSTFSHNAAGEDGGAVQNDGTMQLTTSTFTNNSAGTDGAAMSNSVQATVTHSIFMDNHAASTGGAMSNHGRLTLAMDLLTANLADWSSGALNNFNNGTVSISASTFSNNQATAHNGGALTNNGHMDITASTIANNLAGQRGGGIADSGPISIVDSTLSDNQASTAGGITVDPSGSVGMAGSILAHNANTTCDQAVSYGYNVVDEASCGVLSTDIRSAISLGPLTLAGGTVPTESPLQGNPAIDAIPPGTTITFGGTSLALCVGTDARGVARPIGSGCDSGAVEIAPPTLLVMAPSAGSTYMYGQLVLASYACAAGSDPAPLTSCAGSVGMGQPLDTLTMGSHTWNLVAQDVGGTQYTQTSPYTVIPASITVRLLQIVVNNHLARFVFQLVPVTQQGPYALKPSGFVAVFSNGQQLSGAIPLDAMGRGFTTISWNSSSGYLLAYQGDAHYAPQTVPVTLPAIVPAPCRVLSRWHKLCRVPGLDPDV